MYSVIALGQNVPKNKVICSGINFGFLEQPLTFSVTSERIPEPYPVEFIVSSNKDKKPLELGFQNLSPKGLRIYFYNPAIGGTSGLKTPFGILNLENKYILSLMFYVDTLSSGNAYRISYEFYDGLQDEPTVKGGSS